MCPTLAGRFVLTFYKLRWCLLLILPILAWASLVVICELRMREDGLRNRMALMAKLLETPPADIDDLDTILRECDGKIVVPTGAPEGTTVEDQKIALIGLLEKWEQLNDEELATEELDKIALFLSPDTNEKKGEDPPLVIKTKPSFGGHYFDYGVDLRVHEAAALTKKEIIEDVNWFVKSKKNYDRNQNKGRTWFISDSETKLRPGDEYKFYDYKRYLLNWMIVLGLITSFSFLAFLTGSALGGIEPPTWRQILKEAEFKVNSSGKKITPFNLDTKVTEMNNAWLFAALGIALVVQILQAGERKELLAEGVVNHPTSLLLILALVFVIAIAFRRLSPNKAKSYSLEDYVKYFRTCNWCLLGIPLCSIIVIMWSLGVLLPSDPWRAVTQTVISIGFLAAALWAIVRRLNDVSEIECRLSKDSDPKELTKVGQHKLSLFLLDLDQSWPLQLLGLLSGLALMVLFGK